MKLKPRSFTAAKHSKVTNWVSMLVILTFLFTSLPASAGALSFIRSTTTQPVFPQLKPIGTEPAPDSPPNNSSQPLLTTQTTTTTITVPQLITRTVTQTQPSQQSSDSSSQVWYLSYAPDEIIVKFKEGVTQEQIDDINQEYGTEILSVIEALRAYRLRIPEGTTVQEMLEIYNSLEEVEYAEPNYILTLDPPEEEDQPSTNRPPANQPFEDQPQVPQPPDNNQPPDGTVPSQPDKPEYVEGEFLVKFKQDVTEEQINTLNQEHGVTILSKSQELDVYRLSVPEDKTVSEMVELYNNLAEVEYAEPNKIVRINPPEEPEPPPLVKPERPVRERSQVEVPGPVPEGVSLVDHFASEGWYEDEAKREANTKHFTSSQAPQGTHIAVVSGRNIHFQDNQGNWQEIDNTLVPLNQERTLYQNRANSFKVTFSTQPSSSSLVLYTQGSKGLSLTPIDPNDNFSAQVEGNTILYQNIYPQTDLKYTVTNSGVKEEIILNEEGGKNSFSFSLNLKNLELEEGPDGTLTILDPETKEITLVLPEPYMYDSKEGGDGLPAISDQIEVTVSSPQDNNFTYTVLADSSWLSDPERVYPVVIDPGYEYPGVTDDTYVLSAHPTTKYYTVPKLIAGLTSGDGVGRSFIKFGLPSLPGADILDTRLWLFQITSYATPMTTNIWKLSTPWGEGDPTWNNQPTRENIIASTGRNDIGWWDFNVTGLVRDWYSGQANNGFGITVDPETTTNSPRAWYSRDYGDPNVHPFLEIYYNYKPTISLISPSNGEAKSDTYRPTFTWGMGDANNDTLKPYIQVSTDPGFGSVIDWADLNQGTTSWTIPQYLPLYGDDNTTFYWHVSVWDGEAEVLSPAWSFKVTAKPSASCISPVSDTYIKAHQPSFSYSLDNPIDGQPLKGSQIQIAKDANFSISLVEIYPGDKTSYTLLPSGALTDGKYFWRVKVFDGYRWSEWSSSRWFYVDVSYNASYKAEFPPLFPSGERFLPSDSEVRIQVTIKNTGDKVWRRDGEYPYFLSYHWYEGATTLVWDGKRTPFPYDVPPEQTVTFEAIVSTAGLTTGQTYTLRLDLVSEGNTWFSSKGASTLNCDFTIQDQYKTEYSIRAPPVLKPNQTEENIQATLTNTGNSIWKAGEVFLSYHLYDQQGVVNIWDGLRTPLPSDVSPGNSVPLSAKIKAPPFPGVYLLKWDLVHEGVTWFSERGVPSQNFPLAVSPLGARSYWPSSGPVNLFTGNLSLSVTDVAIPGRGPSITISRTYNSLFPQDGIGGYGWTFDFETRLLEPQRQEKIVYYDSNYPSSWILDGDPLSLVTFLEGEGFVRKNASQLGTWMTNKVASGDASQSVVVMSMGIAPDTVADVNSDQAIIRRYLNQGGRVVWVGDIQFYYQGHAGGGTTLWDVQGSENILGVGKGEWDNNTDSTITQAGNFWGMKTPDKGIRQVPAAHVTEVLSKISEGNASSWFKRFSPYYPDAGFVRYRADEYDDNNSTLNEDILRLATYTGYIQFKTSDGGELFFFKKDGKIVNPPGFYTTLTKNQDGTYTLKQKGNTRYNFSSEGKPLTIVDKNGNVLTYTYDAEGKLEKITDATGDPNREVYLYYYANGRVSHIKFPAPCERGYTYVGYSYYQDNLVIATFDPSYDPDGAPYQGLELHTYYYYDSLHRLNSIIQGQDSPEEEQTSFWFNLYDPLGKVTTIIDPRTTPEQPISTAYSYDPDNKKVTVTDPEGNSTTYTYNNYFNLSSVTDAEGNTSHYVWDSKANLLFTENAHQGSLKEYDCGEEITKGDVTKSFTFDKISGITLESAVTYDEEGRPLSATDAKKNKTTLIYDGQGNPINITDATSNTQVLVYDQYGNLISITDSITPSENLILNSSFEEDLASWQNNGKASFGVVDTYHSSGKKSLKVEKSDWDLQLKNAAEIYQEFSAISDAYYVLSLNYRGTFSEGIQTPETVGVTVSFKTTTGEEPPSFANEGWKASATDIWTPKILTFKTPESTNQIKLVLKMSTNGEVFFDDVQLEQTSMPSFYNVIQNPGFERGFWGMEASSPAISWKQDNHHAFSGTYSLKQTHPDFGQSSHYLQEIPEGMIEGGKEYTFTTWVKTEGYFEDFNDGRAEGWIPVGGIWEVKNGKFHQVLTSDPSQIERVKAYTEAYVLDNFTILAKLEIVQKTGDPEERIGIIAHKSLDYDTKTKQHSKGDWCLILRQDKLWLLEEWVAWHTDPNDPGKPDPYPFSYQTGDVLWLKMDVEGNTVKGKVWKDGEGEPSSWQVSASTFSNHSKDSTKIGLYATRSHVAFDQVKVVSVGSKEGFYEDFRSGVAYGWIPTGGSWKVEKQGQDYSYRQSDVSPPCLEESTKTYTETDLYDSFTVLGKVTINTLPGTGEERIGLIAHKSLAANSKGDWCLILSNGQLHLLEEHVAFHSSTSFTYSGNNTYWFKLHVAGNTAKGKVWEASLDEPSSWNIESSNFTTESIASPRVGLYAAKSDVEFSQVKVTSDGEEDGVGFKIEWRDSSQQSLRKDSSSLVKTQGKWQLISFTTKAPQGATRAVIYLTQENFKGSSWFDCVKLQEKAATTYQYDKNHNYTTKVIDAKGEETEFKYDLVGNLLEKTEYRKTAEGKKEAIVTSYTYDTQGKVLSMTLPDPDILHFDDFSNDTSHSYTWDPAGSYYEWDKPGERLKVTSGPSTWRTFSYRVARTDSGLFEIDFEGITTHGGGGQLYLRLNQDSQNYYEFKATDGLGEGYVAKVVGGITVTATSFSQEYDQNMPYSFKIEFSPENSPGKAIFYAFGQRWELSASTDVLDIVQLEVALYQQDAYFDNIKFTQVGGADVISPQIEFTSPQEGEVVFGTKTIDLSVTDNRELAKVELEIDDRRVATYPPTPPYQYDWDTTQEEEGKHTIKVIAFDAEGNLTEETIKVVVDNTSPIPQISLPLTPYYTNSSSVTLSGVSEPNSTVEIFDGPTSLVTTTADSSGSWSVGLTLLEGSHSLKARVGGGPFSDSVKVFVDQTFPTISNPLPLGGSYTSDSKPAISATLEDNLSPIDFCQLELNGVRVGDGYLEEAAPLTYTLTYNHLDNLADGECQVLLTAKDKSGNQASLSWTFTVDTESPSKVEITSPLSYKWVSGIVLIKVEAEDAIGIEKVEFLVDGGKIGEDTTSPYQFSWNSNPYSNGDHAVGAIAIDKAGNITEDEITAKVDNTSPSIGNLTPVDGSVITEPKPTISADVSDPLPGSEIDLLYLYLKLNGFKVPYSYSSGQVSYTPPEDLDDGTYTAQLEVADKLGNSTYATWSFTVDTQAPTCTITSPSDGDVISGTVTISVTATDPGGSGIDRVEFYAGGGYLGEDNTSPYSYNWDTTTYADGTHTIEAKAFDQAENQAAAAISVTVDNTPLTISGLDPADGVVVGVPRPEISGWLADNLSGIDETTIEMKVDGGDVTPGYNSVTGAFSYEPATDLSEGSHTVDVSVKDKASNQASVSWSFSVDTQAPTCTITSPSDGDTVSGTVSVAVQASDSPIGSGVDRVEFYIDAEATPRATDTTSPYSYDWDTTGLTGSHTIEAKAYDRVGNIRADQISVTVGSSTSYYTRTYQPYAWINGGNALGIKGDDTGKWYTLPFPFPFYGVNYSQVYLSSNGLMRFDASDKTYYNSTSGLSSKVAIAPLWDDLHTNRRTNDNVYVSQPTTDSVCIRWQAVTYSHSYDTNFEVILYQNGTIRFNYGTQGGGLTQTIGISKGNSQDYILAHEGKTNTNQVESVVFSPGSTDTTSPQITELYPPDGAIITPKSTGVTVSAKVEDLESGIDASTVKMKFDGEVVSHTYNSSTGLVSYDVTQSLTGWHSVYLEVKDNQGNKAYKEWWFDPPQEVIIQPDPTDGKDNYLNEYLPTSNYGTSTYLIVTDDEADDTRRPIIQFDLSQIPASASITSATLSLYLYNAWYNNDIILKAYRVTESWDEATSTWRRRDSSNYWNIYGGEYESPDCGAVVIQDPYDNVNDGNSSNNWFNINLTPSLVEGWVNGSITNNGLLLIGYRYNGEGTNRLYFRSSDYTTDPSLRPKLTVSYTEGPPPNNPPVASFNFAPATPLEGQAVTFTDTSTDSDGTVSSWSWNFGDGSASGLKNPTHTYSTQGTYTVTLTVTDDDGATDSDSQVITVTSASTGTWTKPVAAYACSEYSTSFRASNAVDGNTSTHWFTSYNHGPPCWIYFDLGSGVEVDKLRVNIHYAYVPVTVDIQLSSDATFWTTVKSDFVVDVGSVWKEIPFSQTSARYIRLYEKQFAPSRYYGTCTEVDVYVLDVATDTEPPQVSITSPSDGDALSGTVVIQATATDNVAVDRVEFFIDGSLEGTDTTSSYSYSWDTTTYADGTYTIEAKAFDQATNSATASISLTVDNTAPQVSITSPSDGQIVGGTVTIEASATDPGGSGIDRVEFYAGGGYLGEDDTTPYSYSWDTTTYADGTYTIEAKAFDQAENQAAATISLTVDNTAPAAPVITSPTSPYYTNSTSVDLSGTAEASSTLKIYDGASEIDSTTADGSGNWSITLTLAEGSYSLVATATDEAGNESAPSSTLDLTIDLTSPTCTITSPSDGDALSGAVVIQATATDNIAVERVEFLIDGSLEGTDTTSPYSYFWNTTSETESLHTIEAKAYDQVGNQTTATISVVVDNTAPQVSLTSPSDDQIVGGTVTIEASATDPGGSGIDRVEFYAGGGYLGEDNTSPYSYNWDTTSYSEGNYTIEAKAYDKASNQASDSIDVVVDNTPPEISSPNPPEGSCISNPYPLISARLRDEGAGIDGSTIKIKIKVNVDTPDEYELELTQIDYNQVTRIASAIPHTPLPKGDHQAFMEVKDKAGNLATRAWMFDPVNTTVKITYYYQYNKLGRLVLVTDPKGYPTRKSYLKGGLLDTVIDPLGIVTKYEYDKNGNVIKVIQDYGDAAQGCLNRTAINTYNSLGQLIEEKDPEGNIATYGYDEVGNQTKVVDPLGNTILYTYDGQGKQIAVTPPLTPNPSPLFIDNFTSPEPVGWTPLLGNWKIEDGKYSQSDTLISPDENIAKTKAYTEAYANDNFTLSAKVTIEEKTGNSGERIGIIAHKSEDANSKGDWCLILMQDKLWLLEEYVCWWTDDADPQKPNPYPFPYQTGDVLWFKFHISGTTAKGKVWKEEDLEPSSWQVESKNFSLYSASSTKIGLYAARTHVHFDEVKITQPKTFYDFDDGDTSDWTELEGNWQEEAGKYSQSDTSITPAIENTKAYVDANAKDGFMVLTKVEIVTKTGDPEERIGLVAHKTEEADSRGDWCLILRQEKLWLLEEYVGKYSERATGWYDSAPFSYSQGKTYWMRMEVEGTRVQGRVWEEGTPEPSVWQVSFSYFTHYGTASTKIGLYAARTYARFDEVQVLKPATSSYDLGGNLVGTTPPLWEPAGINVISSTEKTYSKNLLKDASFESGINLGDPGSPWKRVNISSAVYPDPTIPKDGGYYLQTNTSLDPRTNDTSFFQDVKKPLYQEEVYTFSVWVRSPCGHQLSGAVALWGLNEAITIKDSASTVFYATGLEWMEVKTTLKIKKSGLEMLRAQVYLLTSGGENFDFDAAFLKQVLSVPRTAQVTSSSPPENLLKDSSFESGKAAGSESPWNPNMITSAAYRNLNIAKSGQWYLQLNTQSSGSLQQDVEKTAFTPELNLEPGQSYTFSIWVRSPNGHELKGTLALWALGGEDENADNHFTTSSIEWTKVETTLKITRPGHTRLRTEVYLGNNGENYDLDEAYLKDDQLNFLIDGNTKDYGNNSGYAYVPYNIEPKGSITVALDKIYPISAIRMLLWDREADRYYEYKVEVSQDGENWTKVAVRADDPEKGHLAAKHSPQNEAKGWQNIVFSPIPTRFIKVTGLYNNKNNYFHLVELEAYTSTSTTANVYDGEDQLQETIDPLGRKTSASYDANGNTITETDAKGNITTSVYDREGRLKMTVDPLGYSTSYEYDEQGNQTKEIDQLGKTAQSSYDLLNRLAQTIDRINHRTNFFYDFLGNLTKKISHRLKSNGKVDVEGGIVTAFEYDPLGNLLAQTIDPNDPDIGYIGLNLKTTSAYDALGRTIEATSPKGNVRNRPSDYVLYHSFNEGEGTVVHDGSTNNNDGTIYGATWTEGKRDKALFFDGQDDYVNVPDSASLDITGGITLVAWINRASIVSPTGGDKLISKRDPMSNAWHLDLLGTNLRIEVWNDSGTYFPLTTDYPGLGEWHHVAATVGGGQIKLYIDGELKNTRSDFSGTIKTNDYDVNIGVRSGSFPDGFFNGLIDEVLIYNRALSEDEIKALRDLYTTTYAYDLRDLLKETADPLGIVVTHNYDALGRRYETILDPSGLNHKTSFAYDILSNLVKVTDPRGAGNTTSYTYDALGRKTQMTDAKGTTYFFYDNTGRLVSSVDPLGNKTHFVYDENNNLTAATDGCSKVTSEYDKRNLLTQEHLYLFEDDFSSGSYNDNWTVKSGTWQVEENELSQDNETLGRTCILTNQDDFLDFTLKTKVKFLSDNQEVQLLFRAQDQDNHYEVWLRKRHLQGGPPSYDTCLRKKVAGTYTNVLPEQPLTNLVSEKDGYYTLTLEVKGNTYTFYINGIKQLEAQDNDFLRPGKIGFSTYCTHAHFDNVEVFQAFSCTYDQKGRRTKVAYPSGKETGFFYDDDDRLVKVVEGGEETNYSYDSHDNLTSITYPVTGSQYIYVYDKADRLVEIKRNDGGIIRQVAKFSYDENSNLLEKIVYDLTGGSPVHHSFYTYDDGDRLTHLKTTTSTTVQDVYYTYDNAGNILTISGTQTASYTYDQAGQLLQDDTYSYTYDENSNMKTKGGITYTYNEANQLKDDGTNTYTYDASGNLTSNGVLNFFYDSKQRLIKITKVSDGSLVAEYTYDSEGRRTSKTVYEGGTSSTTCYYYNEITELVLVEIDQDGKTKSYLPTTDEYGDFISITIDGITYYYVLNGKGDVVALLDDSGNLKASWSYDSWGVPTEYDQNGVQVDVGTAKNPYLYRGYYYDTETHSAGSGQAGLYYLYARYYDPTTGRFLTKDPDPGADTDRISLNPYIYAYNDPVNVDDPDGHGLLSWLKKQYRKAKRKVKKTIRETVRKVKATVTRVARAVARTATRVARAVTRAARAAGRTIKRAAASAGRAVKRAAASAGKTARRVGRAVARAARRAGGAIAKTARGALAQAKSAAASVRQKLAQARGAVAQAVRTIAEPGGSLGSKLLAAVGVAGVVSQADTPAIGPADVAAAGAAAALAAWGIMSWVRGLTSAREQTAERDRPEQKYETFIHYTYSHNIKGIERRGITPYLARMFKSDFPPFSKQYMRKYVTYHHPPEWGDPDIYYRIRAPKGYIKTMCQPIAGPYGIPIPEHVLTGPALKPSDPNLIMTRHPAPSEEDMPWTETPPPIKPLWPLRF